MAAGDCGNAERRCYLAEVIKSVSGCDGTDDYARGWDDACAAILREIERRAEPEKACWNCLHEEACSWEPAGVGDCCKKWQPEKTKNISQGNSNPAVTIMGSNDSSGDVINPTVSVSAGQA